MEVETAAQPELLTVKNKLSFVCRFSDSIKNHASWAGFIFKPNDFERRIVGLTVMANAANVQIQPPLFLSKIHRMILLDDSFKSSGL